MNPFDDVPVTGGMNTTGNGNNAPRGKKTDSKKLGYVNVTVGGHRIGTITIETEPFGFQTNPMHETLLQLFSLDITSEQLNEGLQEILSFGVEFDPQFASKPKAQHKPTIDFAAKFGAKTRTLA